MASKVYHTGRCGPASEKPSSDRRFQDGDVSPAPVEPVVVEPVADHELVGDHESHVVHRDLDLAPRHLVEQHAEAQAPGMAGGQVAPKIADRAPGVDDVLDD